MKTSTIIYGGLGLLAVAGLVYVIRNKTKKAAEAVKDGAKPVQDTNTSGSSADGNEHCASGTGQPLSTASTRLNFFQPARKKKPAGATGKYWDGRWHDKDGVPLK